MVTEVRDSVIPAVGVPQEPEPEQAQSEDEADEGESKDDEDGEGSEFDDLLFAYSHSHTRPQSLVVAAGVDAAAVAPAAGTGAGTCPFTKQFEVQRTMAPAEAGYGASERHGASTALSLVVGLDNRVPGLWLIKTSDDPGLEEDTGSASTSATATTTTTIATTTTATTAASSVEASPTDEKFLSLPFPLSSDESADSDGLSQELYETGPSQGQEAEYAEENSFNHYIHHHHPGEGDGRVSRNAGQYPYPSYPTPPTAVLTIEEITGILQQNIPGLLEAVSEVITRLVVSTDPDSPLPSPGPAGVFHDAPLDLPPESRGDDQCWPLAAKESDGYDWDWYTVAEGGGIWQEQDQDWHEQEQEQECHGQGQGVQEVQAQDQVWQGQEMVWQGQEPVWQGQDMVWQGQGQVWQGQDQVWQGQGMMWQGQEGQEERAVAVAAVSDEGRALVKAGSCSDGCLQMGRSDETGALVYYYSTDPPPSMPRPASPLPLMSGVFPLHKVQHVPQAPSRLRNEVVFWGSCAPEEPSKASRFRSAAVLPAPMAKTEWASRLDAMMKATRWDDDDDEY